MKYTVLHKITSTILAALVLFSTCSFTVEKHYCGDKLIDVAVFSEVKGCGMEMKTKATATLNKSCCKDVVDVIEGQDNLLVKALDKLNFSQQVFFTVFVYTSLIRFEDISKYRIPHKYYKPPNLVEDTQLLHDTFLI